MIADTFVIDAVAHGYNFAPHNLAPGMHAFETSNFIYHGLHAAKIPRGQAQWVMPKERFLEGGTDPELLAHAFFAESQTDFCIYHGVGQYNTFKDGGSPLSVGLEMKRRYPHRVGLYGPSSPWLPGAVDEIDRMVDEHQIDGVKFYPFDIYEGRLVPLYLDDPEMTFPVIERARKRGIKVIGIHKALPLGPSPIKPLQVTDVEGAAAAFPDVVFEIVHGGMSFLEETKLLMMRYQNVIVNLEGATTYLTTAPHKFARILGELLEVGGARRIVWASGCIAHHPQPMLEAFWKFQMPEELMENFGYPQVTPETKRLILSGNIARIMGWDLAKMRAAQRGDPFDARGPDLAEPWSSLWQPSTLGFERAYRIVNAAMATALEKKLEVAVSVVDNGGRVLANARTDRIPHTNLEIATRKARASASFGVPTHMVLHMVGGDPAIVRAFRATEDEMLVVSGGYPTGGGGGLGISCLDANREMEIAEIAVAS